MKISVFGLGYVGAVSAACLARDGNEVIGVDIDPGKLDMFRNGTSPIVEDGMAELVRRVTDSGHARVTDNIKEAITESALSFVCVGTPSRPNGSQDLTAVKRVCEEIGRALQEKAAPHVVVLRSTVVPGTVDDVLRPILESESRKQDGIGFDVCFMPEFLREGSSIRDFDNPPYTVLGTSSERAARVVRDLFAELRCPFYVTSVRTAEMLKYSANVFHATKVTFANEIGRLCQAYGVNSHEVMELFCRDTSLNISPAYLKPGFAFGGSCLPKDLRAVLHMAKTRDVEVPMLQSLGQSNAMHIQSAIDMVLEKGRPSVGLIGLSFKSGTDDLRESPLVTLAEHFLGKGLKISIYDPEVNLSRLIGANKRFIETTIPHIGDLMTADCRRLIKESDVLVLGIRDSDALELLYREARPEQVLLDLINVSDREKLPCVYRGVCW